MYVCTGYISICAGLLEHLQNIYLLFIFLFHISVSTPPKKELYWPIASPTRGGSGKSRTTCQLLFFSLPAPPHTPFLPCDSSFIIIIVSSNKKKKMGFELFLPLLLPNPWASICGESPNLTQPKHFFLIMMKKQNKNTLHTMHTIIGTCIPFSVNLVFDIRILKPHDLKFPS